MDWSLFYTTDGGIITMISLVLGLIGLFVYAKYTRHPFILLLSLGLLVFATVGVLDTAGIIDVSFFSNEVNGVTTPATEETTPEATTE